jgi:hypothetical protein
MDDKQNCVPAEIRGCNDGLRPVGFGGSRLPGEEGNALALRFVSVGDGARRAEEHCFASCSWQSIPSFDPTMHCDRLVEVGRVAMMPFRRRKLRTCFMSYEPESSGNFCNSLAEEAYSR